MQSLTLLEYLLKTGSDRIPKQSQENIHIIKPLVEYRFTDKDGKDQVPAQVDVFTEGSGGRLISQESVVSRIKSLISMLFFLLPSQVPALMNDTETFKNSYLITLNMHFPPKRTEKTVTRGFSLQVLEK